MFIKKTSRIPYDILAVILLCIITRLPQLLSPLMMMDGDECILGLMAKHIHDGKELPVYFYGQAYGFSMVEAGLASVFYFIGGVSDYSVKAAMLLLWTTGVVFLYKTLQALARDKSSAPLWVTIIFILAPAWAVWSMKARGGYLTSFTCSFIVTWLLFGKHAKKKAGIYFITGLLLTIIFESQPLWVAGLMPFVVYALCTQYSLRRLLYLFAGAVTTLIPFIYLQKISSHFWQPGVFSVNPDLLITNIKNLPLNLFNTLHGYYYLSGIFQPSSADVLFVYLFLGLLILLIAVSLYFLFTSVRIHFLSWIALLSVLLTVFYSLFLDIAQAPRYLLPFTGYACIFIFLFLQHIGKHRLVAVVYTLLIITGSVALFNFKDYSFNKSNKADLLAAIKYMQQQKIHYAFTTGGLLQWQIMFYSREDIVARYVFNTDRYPTYIQAVNNALAEKKKTAFIEYAPVSDVPGQSVVNVNGYCVLPGPDKVFLEKLGFAF